MNRLFLLIFLVAINYNSLFSSTYTLKQTLEVGNEPVAVYDGHFFFHVFCKGTDKNFNGIFEPDSGDVAGSWWKITSNGLASDFQSEKVADFPFGSIPFPFRPAFSSEYGKVFINQKDGIQAYSLNTYHPIGDKYEITGVTGLDFQNNYLFITQSSPTNKVDTIIVLNTDNNEVLAKYPVGKNLQQAKYILPENNQKSGIVAISTGGFGSDSSEIHFSEFDHFAQPQFTSKIVGNTVNSLEILDNLYATISVMMSHKVMVFNVNNKNLVSEINTPTTGWDGPAYAKLFQSEYDYYGKKLFTVAYDCKFYAYTENQGATENFIKEGEIELSGKGQSFDIVTFPQPTSSMDTTITSIIAVVSPLKCDYSPNNKVDLIIKKDIVSSVNSHLLNKLYHFVDNSIIFDQSYIINNFTLMDINGSVIYKADFPINQYDLSYLSSGIYFISFINNEKLYFEKINLVK